MAFDAIVSTLERLAGDRHSNHLFRASHVGLCAGFQLGSLYVGHMKIQVNGKKLHYVAVGSGETLLLVHGFPLDHQMWTHQIENLSKKLQVVAVDLTGFGQSERGEGAFSMKSLAGDLAVFLDQLGIEKVHFCGLSMGGYVGWQFWKHHSQRLRSLILCDTRAVADDQTTARARSLGAEMVRKYGSQSLIEKLVPKLFAESSFEKIPDQVQLTREMIANADAETVALAHLAMAKRPDATSWLTQIDLPTLFVVGEHDQISTPDEMRTMANAVPGSKYMEIPNAGHMAPMENPARFNEAIAGFLMDR